MLLNLDDYEQQARQLLDPMAYGYYAAGADDELTLDANRKAYRELALAYRVLASVGERRDLSTSILGHPVSLPVLAAPTAFHGLATPEAELASVRAVTGEGSIFCLSTLSNVALEEVVKAASGPVFFQVYIYKDRGGTKALVERARDAGCKALVLTVDAPVLGRRERDVRNEFRLPPGLEVKNMPAAPAIPGVKQDSGLAAYALQHLDPDLGWKDLEWLCGLTGLPVLVKGVVRPDDAVRSLEHGAAGVVVSNHGGRQLDTAVASIRALPRVAEAMAGRGELLVDGGVRRGTDIVKALALGARAVLLGRPILWGLAVDGEKGVRSLLGLLRNELDQALALCGCRDLAAVDRSLLF
ncbi:MAG: alpha-hydroxy-acid oxidizing enzyme [Candidatus Xenobia bacterium]